MKTLKKFSKIIVSCLLTFSICFNYTLIYWGDDNIENAEVKVLCVNNVNQAVALEQIKTLVRVNCTKNQTMQVGDCISVYNAQSDNLYYIYPVYADSKCEYIAEVSVDGSTVLTDNIKKMDILNHLSGREYILYIDNGKLYAQSKADNLFLTQEYASNNSEKSEFYYYSYDEKISYYEKKFGESNICFENILQRNYVLQIDISVEDIETRSVVVDKDINMTYKYKCNISNFVLQGNHWLCWAAACATIINYKTSSSVTPKFLADKYDIGYDKGANTYQIKTCLNDYNLTYGIYYARLPWAKIKTNINADKPFVICMKATKDSGEIVGHSITGYGYSCFLNDTSAGMRAIYAWDSNGSHISFLDTMTVINLGGYSYKWFGSVY